MFGDGATSSLQNPTHTYSQNGVYTVTLTATDNDGATAATSQQITVRNVPPAGSFTYAPANPTTANRVSFTDTSTDLDGTIVSRRWVFGDGATSTAQNPTHRYRRTGTYTVSLTVTDNDGATGTGSQQITVTPPNRPPVASFTYTPANPTTLDVMSFTDTSTDPDGTVVAWAWAFGDGATSTAQNPTHQYTGRRDLQRHLDRHR